MRRAASTSTWATRVSSTGSRAWARTVACASLRAASACTARRCCFAAEWIPGCSLPHRARLTVRIRAQADLLAELHHRAPIERIRRPLADLRAGRVAAANERDPPRVHRLGEALGPRDRPEEDV